MAADDIDLEKTQFKSSEITALLKQLIEENKATKEALVLANKRIADQEERAKEIKEFNTAPKTVKPLSEPFAEVIWVECLDVRGCTHPDPPESYKPGGRFDYCKFQYAPHRKGRQKDGTKGDFFRLQHPEWFNPVTYRKVTQKELEERFGNIEEVVPQEPGIPQQPHQRSQPRLM